MPDIDETFSPNKKAILSTFGDIGIFGNTWALKITSLFLKFVVYHKEFHNGFKRRKILKCGELRINQTQWNENEQKSRFG